MKTVLLAMLLLGNAPPSEGAVAHGRAVGPHSQTSEQHQNEIAILIAPCARLALDKAAGGSDGQPEAVEADRLRWYLQPDWWVAGFTAGLLLVTGLLWWVTRRMWQATDKAIADANANAAQQSEETRAALVAAQRSADAATKQADLAERHAAHQLRAYLGFEKITANVERGELNITIKNFGRTPASDVNISLGMRSANHIFPPSYSHAGIIEPGNEFTYMMVPAPGDLAHIAAIFADDIGARISIEATFLDFTGGRWMRRGDFIASAKCGSSDDGIILSLVPHTSTESLFPAAG